MKHSSLRRFAVGAIAAAVLATTSSVFAGGPTGRIGPLPEGKINEVIVKLDVYESGTADLGISAEQMTRLERAAGVQLHRVREMSGGARILGLPRSLHLDEVGRLAKRIASVRGVVYAVPNRIMRIQAIPNDPRYNEQWHYFEAIGGIELPGAWDITTGDPNVYAAVIDTGIRGDHEDLAGRWTGGYDFISPRFIAHDGDGRDADPSDPGDGFLFTSSSWHGSHVAGTIGAASNNGTGVTGVNWESTIVPVRVLGRLGGTTGDILDAVRWAAGLNVPGVPSNPNPVDVMNLSLGGGGTCDNAWQDAVDDAVAAGSVIVVAAGNASVSASNHTPSSCEKVITVAATDRTGDLAWYSNFGASVEISAPGGDTSSAGEGVLSTVDSGNKQPSGDAYAFYQGTSMAAPHVTGVVTLLKSVNSSLTPAQILDAIQQTAKPFPAGSDCDMDASLCGAGIVDAEAALLYVLGQ